jgi:hypothetical protein
MHDCRLADCRLNDLNPLLDLNPLKVRSCKSQSLLLGFPSPQNFLTLGFSPCLRASVVKILILALIRDHPRKISGKLAFPDFRISPCLCASVVKILI